MTLLSNLTKFLTEEPKETHKDSRVSAMEKALNNTTPHYAGTPWDHKIPEVSSEDEAKQELLNAFFEEG
jgi:hypothetical protein